MSKVKSYLVCLPKWEYALNDEHIEDMREKLNSLVGKGKYEIIPKQVPYNNLEYIAQIWAFDVKEQLNRNIISAVEKYLDENGIEYTEYSMYLPLNESRFFAELRE